MRVGDGRVMFIKGKLMPSDTEYEVVRTIVQCKDCKYSWTPEHPNKYYCHINYHISKDDPDGYADNEIEWNADDFCSRGEKR